MQTPRIVSVGVLGLVAAAMAGCVGATPYQPLAYSGGYSETPLGPTEVMVRFAGNGHTTRDRVYDYALYRCAELTTELGFSRFLVVEDRDASTHGAYATTNYIGNSAITRVHSIDKPAVAIRIRLYKDEDAPKEAYSADFILRTLEPRIERPVQYKYDTDGKLMYDANGNPMRINTPSQNCPGLPCQQAPGPRTER